MNRISINLKCGDSVQITDEEKLTKDQLLESLSTLFSVNSVAILKTNKTSVIVRPSDISSVMVEELQEPMVPVTKPVSIPKPKEKPPKKQPEPAEHIDIITDMDA